MGPKQLIMYQELKVTMCFINPDPHDYSYFHEDDIYTHSSLREEIMILSSAIITAIQMQAIDA